MELTTMRRFQRLYKPHSQLFYCFRLWHVANVVRNFWLRLKHAEGMSLRYCVIFFWGLTRICLRLIAFSADYRVISC